MKIAVRRDGAVCFYSGSERLPVGTTMLEWLDETLAVRGVDSDDEMLHLFYAPEDGVGLLNGNQIVNGPTIMADDNEVFFDVAA